MRPRRAAAWGLAALVLVLAGLASTSLPDWARPGLAAGSAAIEADVEGHARRERSAEIKARFEQAVVMLHARQYEHAAVALQRVLQLAPRLPEAEVNLGFALLGLQQPGEARAAFERAVDLRAEQANAYYGLALAHDALGQRAAARGAMRTYLHLSAASDTHRAKARAALWEWEQADAAAQAGGAVRPRSVVRIDGTQGVATGRAP